MKSQKSFSVFALFALIAMCLGVSTANAASTMDNLMEAYAGEMNAHTRYLAFSKKAEAEGYHQVASLFRAAAEAEFVHAENHAEVIRSLGGEAKAEVVSPVVKTTAENLKDSIKGESYERDTMYPNFIAQAKEDRNRDAIRSFNFAATAEASHAKFYKEALDNLEQWRDGKKDFYVCQVCGETLTALPASKCPSCFSPKEVFRLVN